MANDATTTNQPTETLVTFKVSDSFDGDFEVKVNWEGGQTFVVRGRGDEALDTFGDAKAAFDWATNFTGWA